MAFTITRRFLDGSEDEVICIEEGDRMFPFKVIGSANVYEIATNALCQLRHLNGYPPAEDIRVLADALKQEELDHELHGECQPDPRRDGRARIA